MSAQCLQHNWGLFIIESESSLAYHSLSFTDDVHLQYCLSSTRIHYVNHWHSKAHHNNCEKLFKRKRKVCFILFTWLKPNEMSCVPYHCQRLVAVIWLLSLVYDSLEVMLRSTDMELSTSIITYIHTYINKRNRK